LAGFLVVRGHNAPGGGFAGGLVASAGLVIYSLATQTANVRRILRFDPRSYIGIGLLVALASALVPIPTNKPLLTGIWTKTPIEVGTPVLFDVGVFLVVFGVCLTMILAVAERDEEEHS
jgi:multicomponent Na+:H+ antiporter subunit B